MFSISIERFVAGFVEGLKLIDKDGKPITPDNPTSGAAKKFIEDYERIHNEPTKDKSSDI